MLQHRSSEIQPVEKTDHGVISEVELQVETSETSKVTKVETTNEAAVPKVGDSEQLAKLQHTIAADRQRRHIKSLVRYDCTYIAYALTVGDEVETYEHSSYS